MKHNTHNKTLNIKIPDYINDIIGVLNNKGYSAYIVGGCVRDSLRGIPPHDWDICTSARPEQVISAFSSPYKVIPTGIVHGTVTVLFKDNKHCAEITTYRTEGEYKDNRHPDTVEFVKSVDGDLMRRDFTINAMAYNPKDGLIDLFGGTKDLVNGLIKCVGDPKTRFTEDGLRILRGLRFASVCGFKIEPNTKKAMFDLKNLLQNISAERIFTEYKKILQGQSPVEILTDYREIFAEVLPRCFSEEYFNPSYIKILNHLPANADMHLKLAVPLLAVKPTEYSNNVMRRLKSDNKTRIKACAIAKYFASDRLAVPKCKKDMLIMLNQLGKDTVLDIITFGTAYNISKGLSPTSWDKALELLNRIISNKDCFNLSNLALKGNDLRGICPTQMTGKILNELLKKVMDGTVVNTHEELIKQAKSLSKEFTSTQ